MDIKLERTGPSAIWSEMLENKEASGWAQEY